jgi:hypothetical protein
LAPADRPAGEFGCWDRSGRRLPAARIVGHKESPMVPEGAMVIDHNELRELAQACVSAAAKCDDPDAAAKLLEIATKILELVRREMDRDKDSDFDGRRNAG